jgi:hypothetical protein
MQKPRSTAVTAAVAFAAALAASGITYASAASEQVAQTPAPRLAVPPQAPMGGDVPPDPNSKGNEGRVNLNNEGRHHEHEGREHEEEGRIRINERTYSSRPGDCITVLLMAPATSLNISNDSRKTVEVFNGPVCDNGSPLAVVGPHDTAFNVTPTIIAGPPGGPLVASFRVIDRDRDCDHDHEGNHEGDRDHR